MDREFERLRSLLYLQGVLPALTEYLEWGRQPLPRGVILLHAPGCLRGGWPHLPGSFGSSWERPLHLHFYWHREVARFFEAGWALVRPGAGFWHLDLLRSLSRTGREMRRAMVDPGAPAGVRAIQMRLLLRCAGLLHGARPRVDEFASTGWVQIRLETDMGEPPVVVWAGFDECGAMAWGAGDPPQPPAAQLRLCGQPLMRRLFNGTLIGEEAVARGEIQMDGDIPLIQSLNLVFEDVEHYIPPL